ncbi:Hint domain-containing protein [Actibacterium pelagium]|uniref:Hedgehog/Intein (Hint) domain-containing protein n=1 Tax=Actibacterium pelagium TaxID=2029103 RepID=A0A917EHR0_9RHOB|nr:Hint domain-containing protein [Actibacterium pelagium]GGE45388.1 hypothetical protein GCM10011517_11240 [Actibacterium pelagium]
MVEVTFPAYTYAEIQRIKGEWVVVSVYTEPLTIDIDDLDGDGTISNDEWDSHFVAHGSQGNDVGGTFYGYVGDGGKGTLFSTNGTIFEEGQVVSDIRENLGNDFELDIGGVVCFTPEALIQTVTGLRPASLLKIGDLVQTRDNGMQEIRWIGQRHLGPQVLQQSPKLRPVMIRKDSFGAGVPDRDLLVSPQHRLLIDDWRADFLFDEPEVLVSAISLIDDTRVTRPRTEQVDYVHFLFDRHEVVLSNNMWTESFFPTDYSLSILPCPQLDEITTLFPELSIDPARYGPCARTTPKTKPARVMATL